MIDPIEELRQRTRSVAKARERRLRDGDTAVVLQSLSLALDDLAELQQLLGESAAAITAWGESVQLMREVNAADEGDGEVLRDLLAGLIRFGGLQRALDDLPAAESLFREAVTVARELSLVSDERADSARFRSYAHSRLGAVLHSMGDEDEARAQFTTAIEQARLARGAGGDTAHALRDLAVALHNLGNLMLGANERPGAEAILGEALELARRARTLATGRASVTYARTLAQVLDTWSALVLRVDRTAGTASLREAVAIMRDVIAVQEDAQTIVELRDSLCALADAVIDDAAGAAAFKEANALYEEAIRLARRLCEGLEFAATGLSELAGTYARAGRGRERAGDTHTALAAFEDALLFARQAYDVDSSDTDALHALRDAIDAVARTRRATGDAAGALTTEQALLFLPRR